MDEKYRPTHFNEMVGNKPIFDSLDKMVKNKNIPHLLFSGPAGLGKTTAGLVIINEIFGSNKKLNYLEINASDENGIAVVRDKIKEFAKYSNTTDMFGNEIPFKIIILDEVDEFTDEAQAALRRTMEMYADRCRFILICNNIDNIIKPIKSRCTKFVFKPVTPLDIIDRVKYICDKESINITDEAMEYIIKICDGDIRSTLNMLEVAKIQSIGNKEAIGIEYFNAIINQKDNYKKLLIMCLNRNIRGAYDHIIGIMKEGIEIRALINEVSKMAVESEKIADMMKADIMSIGLDVEQSILKGCTSVNAAMGYIGKLVIMANSYKKKEVNKESKPKKIINVESNNLKKVGTNGLHKH
jgi:replication factor C small subunit